MFPFKKKKFRFDYKADGFAIKNKNIGFLENSRFAEAYDWSFNYTYNGQRHAFHDTDLRWRAHMCIWAAQNALRLEGDFVECGVDNAILSGCIVKYLDFHNINKKFYLFDTFEGIPDIAGLSDKEAQIKDAMNGIAYLNCFDLVREKMQNFPNVEMVKGILPDTLHVIDNKKISYLSVDLNNSLSEKLVMEILWPKIVAGGIIVIDDYAFKGHEAQYDMWNDFASTNNRYIATLPTGQGLLIK